MWTAFLALTAALGASALDTSLHRYPAREAEWRQLVAKAPKSEREGYVYLLTYMPLADLKSLPAAKVTEAVHLAYVARAKEAWGKTVPISVFLDAVVPYASVTEPRQSMRTEFQAKYLPLVEGTKTPGEAALAINKTLFKDYKVTYNTHRLRTDQSPPETIRQGMATCTGLSIMLVDALRAVGVPSRLAGIPSWPGRGGNHTWVEVWDNGGWHFVGAAEPDDKGLDHAWFAEEAGGAIADKPENSIYAVSYKGAGANFPLVWDPGATTPAENVTNRYKTKEAVAAKAPRLMVEVKKGGDRVIADVVVTSETDGKEIIHGKSLGPQADINLHVSGEAKEGTTYRIEVTYGGQKVSREVKVSGDTVVHIDLDRETGRALRFTSKTDLAALLGDRFSRDPSRISRAKAALATQPYNSANAEAAWKAFLGAPDPELKAEFDAKTVKTADRTSPYKWRFVGEKPKDGWGLVIAMHGGGGAPKEVNDGEWNHMFDAYYKDHPEAGGYVYLALRAPNDEWNGFYDDSIVPLVERLILQFVKYAEVDPNHVYACGASHGGYGTFVIGTKAPYRFAALHPAAGAGTDGETAGENLRNVHFTWAVGENDTAYGRIDRDRAFQKSWDEWKAKYGGFDGGLEVVSGHGHLIGDHEADQTAQLRKYTRENAPKRIIWTQTDDVLHHFYWVEALKPVDKGHIEVTVEGNRITLTTINQGDVALWLSPSLVDLKKPVVVVRDGKTTTFKVKPSLDTFVEGLKETGDPALTAPVRIVVPG